MNSDFTHLGESAPSCISLQKLRPKHSIRRKAVVCLQALTLVALSGGGFSMSAQAQGVCDRTPQVQDEILRNHILSDSRIRHCSGVTSSHLGRIKYLYLQNRDIQMLQANDFLDFTKLEELHLYGNQLTTLPATVFEPLDNLKILTLRGNNLTTLPAMVFSGLSKLRKLRLHRNALDALPLGVFAGLSSLQDIFLDENQLTELPDGVFSNLDNLQILHLHNNELTELPEEAFVGLRSLRKLWLQDNPGAPFRLKVKFELVGAPSAAPMPAEIRLTLPKGAPGNITIPLTVRGEGRLSQNQATLLAGSTQSDAITVERSGWSTVIVYALSSPSLSQECSSSSCYRGFEVIAGDSFTLEANPFTLSLESTRVTVEEGGTAVIHVRSTLPQLSTLTVNYRIGRDDNEHTADADSGDYSTNIATIAPGATTGVIEIPITDDGDIEPTSETFTVSLIEPSAGGGRVLGSTATVTVVILEGVCDRTPRVRDEILEESGIENCTDATSEDLSEIESLNLTSFSWGDLPIQTLKENDFSGLGNLETLYLNGNKLSTLTEGVFSGLGNLQSLSLSYNQLSALSKDIFSDTNGLQSLYLEHNQLSSLPADVFSEISGLLVLNLGDNHLSGLPENVFSDLDSLLDLQIYDNPLNGLSESVFSGLNSLQTLYLDDIGLSTLPATIFSELGSLQSLSLSRNKLSILSATTFSGLSDLFLLSLYENRLSTLPVGVFSGLNNLEYLYLDGNPLSALPTGVFVGLRSLRRLRLSRDSELPFDLKVEFEPIDPLSVASESAEVRLTLREGAPGDVVIDLEVAGGMLSGDRVTLSVGSTQSDIITVERSTWSAVTVTARPRALPEQRCSGSYNCYEGFKIIAGDSFTLEANPFTLSLESTRVTVEEGGTAVIRVHSTLPQLSTLTVNYRIGRDGNEYTADADSEDYSTNVATIAPGATAGVIEIPITDDGDIEPTSEIFTVSLTAPGVDAGYTLGSLTTVTVVIQEGVCDRTPQVRNAILEESGVENCEDVTSEDLSRITSLWSNYSGIVALKANDFAGLGNLQRLHFSGNPFSSELPTGVFSRLGNLQKLYFSGNQLGMLPPDVFAGLDELRVLDISQNQLETLPEDVFSGLGNLETLFIDNNQLETLPPDVFAGLGNLETLFIAGNQLSMLPPDVFAGLDELRVLHISHNQLETLPEDVFVGLHSLQALQLKNNPGVPFDLVVKFESIGTPSATSTSAKVRLVLREGAPGDITIPLTVAGGTPSSDRVRFSAGSTQSDVVTVTRKTWGTVTATMAPPLSPTQICEGLPYSCYRGFRLTAGASFTLEANPFTLSLESTRVTVEEGGTAEITVHSTLPQLSTLTVNYRIGRDGNEYTADADSGDYSTNIATIALGATTGVIEIPITDDGDIEPTSEVFTVSLTAPGVDAGHVLSSLTTATVVIQEGVCDRTPRVRDEIVSSLRGYGVSSCADVTSQYLSRTERLDLHGDRALTLKENDFAGLGNLQELYISDSELLELSASIFSGLDNLQELYLSDNELSVLPEGVFAELGNLQYFHFRDNELIELSVGAFTGLDNLRDLRLYGSQLNMLPAGAFTGLGELRELYIYETSLRALTTGMLSDLGNLEFLYLGENQLSTLATSVFSGLGELRVLYLLENELSTLTEGSFRGLGNLQELYLSDNELSVLPEGVFAGLHSLQILRLDGNSKEPFDLKMEFEPISDVSAASTSAEVRLTLREGAPGNIPVSLTVDGGKLSTNQVTLSTGSTQSEIVTVTRNNWGVTTVTAISSSPTQTCRQSYRPCYSGFEVTESTPFTLEANPFTLSLALTQLEIEEGGTAVIRIHSTLPQLSTLTVNYRIGRDNDKYTADADSEDYSTNVATIAPGENSAAIRIPITDDADIEPTSETFTVSLVEPSAGEIYTLGSPIIANVVIREGICDRTSTVKSVIVDTLAVDDCAAVTSAHLAGITGTMDLSRQGIESLKEGDFSGLVNLRTLYLNYNELSTLSARAFSGLVNLEILRLNSNQLSTLPADMFLSIPRLEVLNLGHNQLNTLPTGVLSGLHALRFLYMSGNELNELPDGVFVGLSSLRRVWLQGNPGALFELKPRFEVVESASGPTLDTFRLRLVVDEAAPFEIAGDLSLENATSPSTRIVIPTGSTESNSFTVTQLKPDMPVVIDLENPLSMPSDTCGPNPCYRGIGTDGPEPFILRAVKLLMPRFMSIKPGNNAMFTVTTTPILVAPEQVKVQLTVSSTSGFSFVLPDGSTSTETEFSLSEDNQDVSVFIEASVNLKEVVIIVEILSIQNVFANELDVNLKLFPSLQPLPGGNATRQGDSTLPAPMRQYSAPLPDSPPPISASLVFSPSTLIQVEQGRRTTFGVSVSPALVLGEILSLKLAIWEDENQAASGVTFVGSSSVQLTFAGGSSARERQVPVSASATAVIGATAPVFADEVATLGISFAGRSPLLELSVTTPRVAVSFTPETLPPLEAGSSVTVSLSLRDDDLQPGQQAKLRVEVFGAGWSVYPETVTLTAGTPVVEVSLRASDEATFGVLRVTALEGVELLREAVLEVQVRQ